jgi:hypothetical protein
MPDYGIIQPAIMTCAEQRLTEVLDYFPNQTEAQSAKLWLTMAVEFSKARAKTVQSIHWQSSPIATRFEVAQELEHQGSLIVGYLKKFKAYWNLAIEGIEDIDEFLRSLPVPDWTKDAEIHHNIRRRELGESVYLLGQLEKEFSKNLLVSNL